jgi:SAM-dependent methyltransferase
VLGNKLSSHNLAIGTAPVKSRTNLPSQLPCPVCDGQAGLEEAFSDIRLHRCSHCGHCFTGAENLELVESYGPEYFQEAHKNWFANPDVDFFKVLRKLIEAENPAADVLDIGCGTGNLLRYLRQKNPFFRLTGIDVAPNRPESGIDFFQGDVATWKFGRQFDVVTSLEVIEHIWDVRAFVAQNRELCRPGGLIIINTVNEASTLYLAAKALKPVGFRNAFERLFSRHHLNHFNLRSLRYLVEHSGLEVERVLFRNSPMKAVDFQASSRLQECIFRAGVRTVFALGKVSGKTCLQTIVCRNPHRPFLDNSGQNGRK